MFKILSIVLGLVIAFLATVWLIGGQLGAPAPGVVGPAPDGGKVEPVVMGDTRGWFFRATPGRACVLLMHGIRADRREMTGRARFLQAAGHASLAIDLQAHGETPGDLMTFGFRESANARAALDYLRENRRCRKVVALGSSLGGAAALLGDAPLDVDGYVLEAVYPDIRVAVANRLRVRLGTIGPVFAPLLYRQLPLRAAIELEQLRPAQAIKHIRAPLLVMNGSVDRRTTPDDARRLFDNAPGHKQLLWFKGAGHENLFEFDRARYGRNLLAFLDAIDAAIKQ